VLVRSVRWENANLGPEGPTLSTKLHLSFTVDVDFCGEDRGTVKPGEPLAGRIEQSVAEAVKNALDAADDEGFDHDMEDTISILADNPVVARLIE
jgi:hypothetical protein